MANKIFQIVNDFILTHNPSVYDLGNIAAKFKTFLVEQFFGVAKFPAVRLAFKPSVKSEQEMRELSGWIASLKDRDGNVIGTDIPLHISRFFPRFKMTDKDATEVKKVYRLAEVARENLKYVYTGNC